MIEEYSRFLHKRREIGRIVASFGGMTKADTSVKKCRNPIDKRKQLEFDRIFVRPRVGAVILYR